MSRRYIAKYVYTEVVRGEPRRFEHESIVEAPNLAAAHGMAHLHFENLARTSGARWCRRSRARWRGAGDGRSRIGTWAPSGRRKSPERR